MNCYGKQGRRCFASKMISLFIAILVLIAVLPMQPIFAYSYDKNYLDYSGGGYTISPELANALDGDNNIKYTGQTGLRVFKINTITKTITLN